MMSDSNNMRDWMIEKIFEDLPTLNKKDINKVYKYIRRLRHGVNIKPSVDNHD